MRCSLAALGLIASLSGALAADYETFPTLRGSESLMPTPPTYTAWRGVYAGVQGGYSNIGASFGTGVNDLAAQTVRNTFLESIVQNLATLPKGNSNGTSFGGFFGYNTEWEGAILGFEINYNRMWIKVAAAAAAPGILVANDSVPGHHFVYGVDVSGSETVRITDLATFRARAGWIAGQFLPYGFIGVAVARADINRSATVSWTRTDTPDPPNPDLSVLTPVVATATDVQNGAFFFGYTGGIGMDVFVMPNMFLRAEWEYVQIPNVKSMSVNLNSFRAAVGLKF
jgi:outer membrane immunogenic protein